MMLLNELREPELIDPAPEVSLPEAVARALEAARAPEGAPGREAWRFYVVEPEAATSLAWLAARRIEKAVGSESARAAYEQWRAVPGWVVVTCLRSDDPDQMERDREASLTAAQRLSLSLWSENVPSKWDPELASDDPAFFELINADRVREEAVGVMLFGHPERRVGGEGGGA